MPGEFGDSRNGRWVESSRPSELSKKSWPSWSSSLFHRLCRRFEVGQLGRLRGVRHNLRAVEVPRDLSFCSQDASSLRGPPSSRKKVGQVGQVPCFVGFFAGSKLAKLADFAESGVIFRRSRFHSICLFIRRMRRVIEAHRVIEKKLAKLVKFPVS